jgi:hypothetical protein
MAGEKAKWLTVAPLVGVLTAWAARIIRGRTESPTEQAEAAGDSAATEHPTG